jgi:DNA-binding transcriptional ArsR family regulator
MANDDVCELLCLDLERGEALRRGLPDMRVLERISEAAKGFGDPTRLALALALRDGGELCVCDLAWVSGRSDKLVSHHLRLLRGAGLARSRKDGRMVLYVITDRGRALLDTLLLVKAVAQ